MFAALISFLLLFRVLAIAAYPPSSRQETYLAHAHIRPSLNVSSCPGYKVVSEKQTNYGLIVQLALAGPPCNAFGHDIINLTVEVTYQTPSRLRVNIYDNARTQFAIPQDVISLSAAEDDPSLKDHSDLEFRHSSNPFEFWISRRSDPDGEPLFDTRARSLPPTPIPPVISDDDSTALDGFPLVFEDQYLQLTSALPLGANIYGLGEVLASSGFRRDVGTDGGAGTIQTMWSIGTSDPIDENTYGSHPVYMEHRYDPKTRRSKSHGVFHFGAAGSDILLLTPPSSSSSLIQYRMIGGTLDFYFFSGPSPQQVIEQYGALVGYPTWQPAWGFGFHLCRWGYRDVNETREQVTKMREANIPLEVMWNDIDLYHAVRDFTTDPVSFPADEMKAFIGDLTANQQHYIPIVDAAIAKVVNASDVYDPYTRGNELDIWTKNPDGSEYLGRSRPGYAVFPDWFANDTGAYWTEALRNWSRAGVNYSGIWLDVNEPTSLCIGSCGTGANLSEATVQSPPALVTEYPEGYNASIWGPSGNITINGTLTFGNDSLVAHIHAKRGLGAAGQPGVDINDPPYTLHNAYGVLSNNTVSTNATHANGAVELDTHNLWGLMEGKATHLSLLELRPGKRPFMISRSTFPSSGRWTGHWLGDNISKWQYMYLSIQGVLQFQLFQIPFVGADTCGFQGNTDEELCNRWMQLSAFMPFYRNHNVRRALSQEPYRWDSVANASRSAISIRYSLLPYWYTLFANASMRGTPPIRALFFEFPDEPELFSVDRQYMIGRDLLVTPVLTPNVSTVDGIFPGQGRVKWRDWYTHGVVDAAISQNTTLDAPLGHINVHIRDGSALLLYDSPAYTIAETRQSPFALLVAQASDGYAFGTAYLDDGESVQPTPNTTLTMTASKGELTIRPQGDFDVQQRLAKIIVLGAGRAPPVDIRINRKPLTHSSRWRFDAALERLAISGLSLDLNSPVELTWSQ
ncbi:glycoside hydrolase family 31 protein [Trametes coccinea BRFM310]|uniref:Glycoside hydrolase family 31 protein n=1 Tax=Trametes coccinea (strain BRFM310) TaxID=1353009 RepID=A0A1Y2IZA3_TRAC3|nr:glycoside hydrolase family 31 protein [Trametes coccinea BRFM310]